VREALPALVRPRAVACLSDVYIISADSPPILRRREQALAPVAALPEDAGGAAAALAGEVIVIFTGSAFLQFSARTGEVAAIPVSQEVAPRRGASVTASGREIVVFGGKSPRRKQYFSETIFLSLQTKTVQVHELRPAPPARWWHSANKVAFGDLWVLDLVRRQWRQITAALPPRRHHAAIALSGNIAVVGGAVDRAPAPMVIFDAQTGAVQSTAEFADALAGRRRVCGPW
jgi:hypothetical protein